MIQLGDTYTMRGGRTLIVLDVADGVVTYLDCYPDGTKAKRRASEIQWTVDEAQGELQRGEGEWQGEE